MRTLPLGRRKGFGVQKSWGYLLILLGVVLYICVQPDLTNDALLSSSNYDGLEKYDKLLALPNASVSDTKGFVNPLNETEQKKDEDEDEEEENCIRLLQDYNKTLANKSHAFSSLMFKELRVLGCASKRYLKQYHRWDQPPLTDNSNPLGDAQLVHVYYDNVTIDLSFVVASALAVKQDLRNLRILLWLPPPIYLEWMSGPPPPFWPDCPRHVSILEYNMTEQCRDTPLVERVAAGLPNKLAYDPSYMTDAVRYILLYKYGGLWVDTDSLFVRDYQDLFEVEFPGYRYVGINGAQMHFRRGGSAITTMIETAAKENRYGPFDGFSCLRDVKFWTEFNKRHNRTRHDRVVVFDKDEFELFECVKWTDTCGLRRKCRFFDDADQVLKEYNETPGIPWYESYLFGVKDQRHRIFHTHNECDRKTRVPHPNSMFRQLLDLYLGAISRYKYCHA